MKNINLKNSLNELHKNKKNIQFVIGPKENLTIDKINKCFNVNKNWKILIYFKSIVKYIHILICLDGTAKAICPINYLISEEDKEAILKQYEFTHLITDVDDNKLNTFKTFGIKIIKYKKIEFKKINSNKKKLSKTDWLVPTSGTTALPKLIKHSFQTLSKNIKINKYKTYQHQTWGLLYDITRYAGYQVFFQALLSGGKLVITNSDETLNNKIDVFIKNNVSNISATPTLWRKILMFPKSKKLNLSQIILGGEAADQSILDALKKIYRFSKITHVYASTEAGLVFSVSDGKSGFPVPFIKKSKNVVKTRIINNRLFLKSPRAALSKLGSERLLSKNGWINSGDIIKIKGKRFFVAGRENGIINVGGDKVIPEEIKKILLECSIVQDAVVYGKKNPFIGNLIYADIQLKKTKNNYNSKKKFKKYINDNLPNNQRPKIINFLKSVIIDHSGKVRIR
jgi:acyl-CoA synthetase (AMP-forming)/AMP-acid ligase II